jgi:tRNA threonylcarbamoyl adenosine modification protein (Sua5/YciO/YrdC/YwlC family)
VETWVCDPRQPAAAVVSLAVERIARGGVVALPTETFYGLAADGANPAGIERVNRLKGKQGAPVLLLAADVGQVLRLARCLPPCFRELATEFWPGPLTLVLRAGDEVPAAVSGGRGTVAVRVPAHAVPRAVAGGLGRAITGPSANRHAAPPPTTAQAVALALGTEIDAILDGGPTGGERPSTVLDLSASDGPPRVLREGAVSAARLAPWLGG